MNDEIIVGLLVLLVLGVGVGLVLLLKRRHQKLTTQTRLRTETATATETVSPPQPAPRRIEAGLGRTREFFHSAIDKLFAGSQGMQFYSDLEEVLLSADVGIHFAEKLVSDLKAKCGMSVPSRPILKKSSPGKFDFGATTERAKRCQPSKHARRHDRRHQRRW